MASKKKAISLPLKAKTKTTFSRAPGASKKATSIQTKHEAKTSSRFYDTLQSEIIEDQPFVTGSLSLRKDFQSGANPESDIQTKHKAKTNSRFYDSIPLQSKIVEDQPFVTDSLSPRKEFQSGANPEIDEFVHDLKNELDDGTIEIVNSNLNENSLGDMIMEEDSDSELTFEETSGSRPWRLFTGRASEGNIYSDPKSQEDNTWNAWETFSAISGMGVKELVHKAETGDLVLDVRSLSRLQKRFLSMQKVYKRQYYRCGDRYVIPEHIPSWSEDCTKLGIKGQDLTGDESLNQKVSLMHGDITTLELDVVVNSVSSHVTDRHDGVAKAIVNSASRLVHYELESIWIILVGEVAATAGYLLPAKYIFHTSGPTKHDEDFTEHLRRCYENCLVKMKQMGLRTLAFPCIATGAKKVDIKQAAMTALVTVKEWLQKNKDSVDKIIFCVYDIDNWACYKEFMPTVFPPGPNTDHSGANLIPAEILRMDKNSIDLYKRALSEGKESVHAIRVMVVGHYGVGKTTLTKRLFGEDVDITKRESTDGIDVHVRRCKVSLDTGHWNISDKDKKTEMVSHRLIKLLKQPMSDSKIPENEEIKTDTDNQEEDVATYDDVDGSVISEDNKAITKGPKGEVDDSIPDDISQEEISNSGETAGETVGETAIVKPAERKEEYILNHLKELIKDIRKLSIDNEDSDTADLSVWDFAGQFVFYATHQVFLSRRAVYLLVTDISKHVQDLVVDDDCYIDSKGANHWKISEFVDFWLNSIHEFCNSSDEEGPPVVLVGTFADKLNPETKTETVDEFFYTLRSSLIDKATCCHLIDEDFAVDNSVVDSNVERLRKQILDLASKQNYWGELIPAKWITLENILVSLKGDGLKVIRKDKLLDLNSTLPVPIETDEELDLFLRFHHESGNILYFRDEKLHDSIILDPQWLIDAFKCLITAKMFCCRKPKIFKKWKQFDQSAILTHDLVEAIWEKEENALFHENKELLLEYLEKLGFIARPLQQSDTMEVDYYFAPCVLKASPPEDLLASNVFENRMSTSKLCFKTSSGFLPTAVFNKLLAACISKWPLSKRNGKPAIFCGCGIFDLQDNHSVYIYFSNHEIQIWLTKLSTTSQEPDGVVCAEVKAFVSDFVQNRFRMSSSIDVYMKCPTANLHSSENAFAVDDLDHKTEVVCNCRKEQHVLRTKELTKYWQYTKAENEENILTDRDLNRIAHHIGKEYQSLGLELGLSKAEIDHINLECKTTVDKITAMLFKWKGKEEGKATLETLKKAMEVVGIDAKTALESIDKR